MWCLTTDVILLFGIFWLQVSVYDNDAISVTATSDFQCNISISDSNNVNFCDINENLFGSDLLESEFESTYAKYVSYLQKLDALIELLMIYINENDSNINKSDCIVNATLNILELIYTQFGSNSVNLCQTTYVTVSNHVSTHVLS